MNLALKKLSHAFFFLFAKDVGLFGMLLQAELVPANINDYREKLLYLSKLRHDLVCSMIPEGALQEVKVAFVKSLSIIAFSYQQIMQFLYIIIMALIT